mmetsp:Transcript_68146/g.197537  ORF Transcript_68146/g.197537 Transcript_68146/m.197537 type:complete len:281 (-) Transcript_68146:286-1128(-)
MEPTDGGPSLQSSTAAKLSLAHCCSCADLAQAAAMAAAFALASVLAFASALAEASAICLMTTAGRCQKQRWHCGQETPNLQPVFLFTCGQACAQNSGWPMEPMDTTPPLGAEAAPACAGSGFCVAPRGFAAALPAAPPCAAAPAWRSWSPVAFGGGGIFVDAAAADADAELAMPSQPPLAADVIQLAAKPNSSPDNNDSRPGGNLGTPKCAASAATNPGSKEQSSCSFNDVWLVACCVSCKARSRSFSTVGEAIQGAPSCPMTGGVFAPARPPSKPSIPD